MDKEPKSMSIAEYAKGLQHATNIDVFSDKN